MHKSRLNYVRFFKRKHCSSLTRLLYRKKKWALQAVLKTQLRCNSINSLPSSKSERWKSVLSALSSKSLLTLLFLHPFIITFSFCLLSQWLEKKDSLPLGWVWMESMTERSCSPSLLPPLSSLPPSLSISLSTIAIMQFRLFPTLAHTLSWKEHEHQYTFLLQKQDKTKSDASILEKQIEKPSWQCRLSD